MYLPHIPLFLLSIALSFPHDGLGRTTARGTLFVADAGADERQKLNTTWQTSIRRMSPDGTNASIHQNISDIGINIGGFTYDPDERRFWVASGAYDIWRLELDGSNRTPISFRKNPYPQAVGLAVSAGKLYWGDTHQGYIWRANTNGSNEDFFLNATEGYTSQPNFAQSLAFPVSIAFDEKHQLVYWCSSHFSYYYPPKPMSSIRRAPMQMPPPEWNTIPAWEEVIVPSLYNYPRPVRLSADGTLYWAEVTVDESRDTHFLAIRRARFPPTKMEEGTVVPTETLLDNTTPGFERTLLQDFILDEKNQRIFLIKATLGNEANATLYQMDINGGDLEVIVSNDANHQPLGIPRGLAYTEDE